MNSRLFVQASFAVTLFSVGLRVEAAGLKHAFCGTYPGIDLVQIASSREARQRNGLQANATQTRSAAANRVGDVAMLVDQGDLVFKANTLDLQGKGLEFRPGYTASRVDRPLDPDGTVIPLGDDDSREVPLPFAFPFFGKTYDRAFVNSDGNLTFEVADSASSSRTLARLVAGPPRIAPLLADFDPSTSGRVSTTSRPDAFIVKWTEVPQFDTGDKNTFQITLFPDGRIAFAYDATNLSFSLAEGATGISAGGSLDGLQTADLSTAAGVTFSRSIGESFRAETNIDLTAVGRAFYSAFGDDYQQIVVYTNRAYIPRSSGAFAYETGVRNSITGIGAPPQDEGVAYGSPSALESVVLMDSITKYSVIPTSRILREETTLSVLAHEVGHRWLALGRFLDGSVISAELLGRQLAHWSFFMNSNGSHDEGNDITDLGGGVFKTGPASQRYGPLDQYMMGLRPASEVPPFFIIRNAVATTGEQTAERAPESNVEIKGTRKDVTVADVIAAFGPRVPAPAPTAIPWRVAFVYVTDGDVADAANASKVDQIRSQFTGYFPLSTEGRMTVETRLK